VQNQNNQAPAPPIIIIGSETFTPGQTKTVNGVPVVVPTEADGSRVVVDGNTVAFNVAAPTGPPVLTVGGNTVTANPKGQFIVGTETLMPGGPAITVDGSTLSLAPSGVAIVNGITQPLANAPVPTAAPALTVNGQPIPVTMIGGSPFFVVAPDQTLTPGTVLTVDGTTYSMPSDHHGSAIVVNGQTSILRAGESVITLENGQHITASSVVDTPAYVLGPDQTLTPGAVLTVDGTTYSMPTVASGSVVVINGVTSTIPQDASMTAAPALTIDGQAYTHTVRDGTTEYVIAEGTTLAPGGVVTVDGTTFSMPASGSGSVVVINGVTSTIQEASITAAPALTIDGQTYTHTVRDGTTEYVIGKGTTLAPGGVVTVDGTTYSLDEQGTALVINGRTSSIPHASVPASNSASTTTTASVRRVVATSGASDEESSRAAETSEGAGARTYGSGFESWVESLVIGVAGWLVMLLV
jgi:hypothetical protein